VANPSLRTALILAVVLSLSACGDQSKQSERKAEGPHPALPAPSKALIPTLNVAKAVGWPKGGQPRAAAGLTVNAFSTGLDHPRFLYVLPNGDVLAAESNAPGHTDSWGGGITGMVANWAQSRAGAGVASPNRIVLLRDSNGDGVADERRVLLSGLNSPFGIALIGNDLYVADTDALLRFPYRPGETHIGAKPVTVASLPAGAIDHHWTKSLAASPDGKFLYVGVGSNSNVGENGLDAERGRALVLQIDAATGRKSVLASGLRNPTGLAFEPATGRLWAVVNERDELGSDLVPDYLTSLKPGAFYGWPFSYWGHHVDARVKPQDPSAVARAIAPDYALGNHVAPLGLAFAKGDPAMPARFRQGAFVSEHGSWNRRPLAGYKVVFVPFAGGRPSGLPIDVLAGFLNADGEAQGRPVGVALDKSGALLVADDVGNAIWRVTGAEKSASSR
jgi:glucose/arabinose dehydrogenase